MGKILKVFALHVILVWLSSDNIYANQSLDGVTKSCDGENCPVCFEMAPFFAKCEEHGIGHKFGNVLDCTKYFTCESNAEECNSGPWGRMEHNCPEGHYFDVTRKECIIAPECPQVCPPKADEKRGCRLDEDKLHDKSDDCHSGIGCVPVETCPASLYETYWTSGRVTCTGEDEFYDAKHGTCVKALACPQSVPEENCPLKWDLMGEKAWRHDFLEISWCRAWMNGGYVYGPFSEFQDNPKYKCQVTENLEEQYGPKPYQTKYEVLSVDNKLRPNITYDKYRNLPSAATVLGKTYYLSACVKNSFPTTTLRKVGKHPIDYAPHSYCSLSGWYEFLCLE